MARTSVGAITISDINDGFNPISVVLGNQSHSFAASSTGAVSDTEKNRFKCELFVYLGASRIPYSASAATSTYDVALTPSGSWTVTSDTTTGQSVIEVASCPTGLDSADKTGLIEVAITVTNGAGNATVVTAIISLSKAVIGAGGAIISLVPSRQSFKFDEAGNTSGSDIQIPVVIQGTLNDMSAFISTNGGAFSSLSVGPNANQAKSVEIDGANGNDLIVISADNFGSAETMAIKVEGGGDAVDVISIVRIQDGNTGAASLLVIITSNVNGFEFRNNTGPAKTLTAKVYDNKDGSLISSGITYAWAKNGVATGTNSANLNVTFGDIANGGSEQFSCTVTVA
jgi:predicted secreted protein